MGLISNFFKAKSAEFAVKAKANEQMLQALEEGAELVTERPGGVGWDIIGRMEKGLIEMDQRSMMAQARKYFRFDPNGRAALMNAVKYIMGRGLKITPKSEDPKIKHIWRDFWTDPRNKMELRQFEIILRTLRDGNCLLQYFNKDAAGASTWKTTVRFRDPMLLQKPTIEYVGTLAQGSMGIEVDPNDVETVTKFWFKDQADQTKFESVAAAQIQHIKILVDSDQKMGESMIQAVMDLFTYYKQWLKSRILLNKIRTAVALIKKVKGTSADVSRISQTLPNASNVRGVDNKTQALRPMSVFTANEGVEYEMLSHNINASDAAEDGRTMVTRMAGGTGQPEYAFGDASNANFSSSLVAESPFVKEIQYWQQIFEFHFKEMFRRVVQAGVDSGVLTAPVEKDPFAEDDAQLSEADQVIADANAAAGIAKKKPADKPTGSTNLDENEMEIFFGCDIQWPEIVHRDIKENTIAVVTQRDAGLISDETAAATLGYDYEEEIRKQTKIEDDAADGSNPFKKPQTDGNIFDAQDTAGDAQMKADATAILRDLTPEEKARVQAMDPAAQAQFVAAKKNGQKKQEAANGL